MEGLRFCSWAPDRLLRDPVVRRMNAEAFGGYCSLLVEIWLDPSGSIPSDPEKLPLLARMGKASWSKYERSILPLFEEVEGRLFSPIVDEALARIAKKSQNGKKAVEAREKKKAENYRKLGLEDASDDHPAMNERSSKEKEKENNKPSSSPSFPSGQRKGPKRRVLAKGDPANEETWALFDEVYPRPDNGRKLERAEARLVWDFYAGEGEDMAKIIDGAQRYRDWIIALDNRKYVAMMTTWLNQRRWEESHVIDPSSEAGKLVQAKKDAETRERRSAHQARFQADYETYVSELCLEGITATGFEAAWRKEVEDVLEKRKRMNMTGAIKLAEKLLSDPDAAREDQIRRWTEYNVVPSFWEWDETINPEAWK